MDVFQLATSGSHNQNLMIGVVLVVGLLLFLNYDRLKRVALLRKLYKDEFDNFDIQAHKNYVTGGNYQVEQADVVHSEPTKTSELITLEDETFNESIKWKINFKIFDLDCLSKSNY